MKEEGTAGYQGTSLFVPDNNVQWQGMTYGLGAFWLRVGRYLDGLAAPSISWKG